MAANKKKRSRGRPRSISAQRRRAIAGAAKEGASISELAAKFGHNRDTIRSILREAGVEASKATAARAAPTPRPEYRQEYAALAKPPEDPLAATEWMHRALAVSAYHVLSDERYEGDERARRRELREISRSMQSLIPRTRLYQAEKLVRGDLEKLNEQPGPDYNESAKGLTGKRYRAPAQRG